ncbi:roadblock/LC7 domain-containing protein [Deinococcus detaillensis]|uniref:Roadblock/LC7 domain-containing protein n=1 Tax=Deinococcus detaillensis TaxID=2592048 RepID=A0A553USF4_9DEIO|nr:roadblock/LC7 domain-containing protein [Deinococcus detaillensis]TSA83133.1 roadblock/LC7 domain-containing protein [Deinococcus detaillensis]
MPVDPLQLDEALGRILSTRGVRYAALVGPDSNPLGSAGTQPPDASFVRAAQAVAQSLSATVGDQPLKDLMMDFADGPVLLTPQSDNLLLVGFDEVGNLGRVRFAVKREISRL